MRAMYAKGQWRALAAEVERLGHGCDVSYYYLGSAAEGLALDRAAAQYFRLALRENRLRPCDGVLDVCDGRRFPAEIDAGLARLETRARNLAD